MSRIPGSYNPDPFRDISHYHTPGACGLNDYADPNWSPIGGLVGPTPGSTGINDHARPLTSRPVGSAGVYRHLHYVVYLNSVRVGGNRNWRNNNMGNIEYGEFAKHHGAIGTDGRFAIFPDDATGTAAARDLLRTESYQDLSIREAIARFAPSEENNVSEYVGHIQQSTGFDPETLMKRLEDGQLNSVLNAIRHFEGGHSGTIYDRDDRNMPEWVRALLNTSVATPTPAPPPSGSTTPANAQR